MKQNANQCSSCGENKVYFLRARKSSCVRCDELLYDIEIECDDATERDEQTAAVAEVVAEHWKKAA